MRRFLKAPTSTHVWLAPSAVQDILAEAKRHAPLETGGMLLGYSSPGTEPEELMVQAVTGPGPDAVHLTNRFEPDATWQQQRLAEAYERSGRTTTYLGDWHTHPGGAPTASRADRRTARRIARTQAARMPRPLMLILGVRTVGDEQQETILVYRWETRTLVAVTAEVLDTE